MRRLPPPWTIVEHPGAYEVRDAAGNSVAFVYFTEPRLLSATPERLLPEEALRVARAIARLPALLGSRNEP